jgi:hypothetical protein
VAPLTLRPFTVEVVDLGGRFEAACLVLADGERCEVAGPGLFPPLVVASGPCRWPGVLGPVLVALRLDRTAAVAELQRQRWASGSGSSSMYSAPLSYANPAPAPPSVLRRTALPPVNPGLRYSSSSMPPAALARSMPSALQPRSVIYGLASSNACFNPSSTLPSGASVE